MDPEQTLAECRRMAAAILDDEADTYPDNLGADAVILAESFQALDGWLKGRGFLPADWAQPQPVPHDNAPSEQEMAEIEAASDRAWEAAYGFNDKPRSPDASAEGRNNLAESVEVYAHHSSIHDGINIEIDAPQGTRITVHVNDGDAVEVGS